MEIALFKKKKPRRFDHLHRKPEKRTIISIDSSRPERCGTSIIFRYKRMRPHRSLYSAPLQLLVLTSHDAI